MLSIPLPGSSHKAHDGHQLRSTVSEQSIELSVWTDDDQKELVSSTRVSKPWKPVTQKAYFLVPTILASGALIAVLQVYLERSNRDTGILFAPKISNLPLRQTFCYLYLPTIVSLVLSFVWTWIDLDVKRLEPFVQLSRPNGALGKESVLLHYPFDFVLFVPLVAIRKRYGSRLSQLYNADFQRHWAVFSASLAVVLIFWGLTPLQSSIFATKMIEKTLQVPGVWSESHLSLHEQKSTLTGLYAQSVYNIAWLNESLPPFMDRDGMLKPFSLAKHNDELQINETWTGVTTLYSVDVNCEQATFGSDSILSSWGCQYPNRFMNIQPSSMKRDQYSTMYTGYWYEESMDSYLKGLCPKEANQTFLVGWISGEPDAQNDETHHQNVNATIWCRPFYYQQEVKATVVPPKMTVIDIVPIGTKEPLPSELLNTTDLEWSMSQGYELNNNRGSFLTSSWPNPKDRIKTKFPELYWDYYLPNMASLALGAYQRPTSAYLDPEILGNSYQAAYRLLLARKLADIFSTTFTDADTMLATRRYQTQTVIMVPTFVYVVECLLATTIIVALLIWVVPSWKKTNLTSEPSSLASLMKLTSNDRSFVQRMYERDCATSQELRGLFQDTTFILNEGNTYQGPSLCCTSLETHTSSMQDRRSKPTPTLPPELSWLSGVGFLALQFLVLTGLAYAYVRADLNDGLPLPSDSLFVNQIVVKYLPMVIGAFFDPIFTWLTRTLCMLQPYEELRKGGSLPSHSLATTYGSLPPQAVMFQTLKTGHLSLVSLCCLMTFLANVVSVAFSNVLYERATMLPTPRNFTLSYQLPINASGFPDSSYASSSYDHFYVAMSNLTAGTPLPAWTDESFFYVPFSIPESQNTSTTLYRAETSAVGVSLDCFAMEQELSSSNLTWKVPIESPKCNTSSLPTFKNIQSSANKAVEYIMFRGYSFDPTCEIDVVAGWGRSSTKSAEQPLVASWIGCKSRILVERREVTVDHRGFVQSSIPSDATGDHNQALKTGYEDIIDAFQTLLANSNTPKYPYVATTKLHSDAYPSDFLNYLMAQTLNSSTNLDPHLLPPSLDATAPVFEAIYAKVFAIVLGTHIETVLHPSDQMVVVTGSTLSPEARVFVSSPMFNLSVAILGMYVLFTVTLYVRRPWRILPRMPTTIVSQIPFFAASHTLQDFSVESYTSGKSSDAQVSRQRYGFGRFVGTDGKTHIGIEREPLVQILTKNDLRTMPMHTDSQRVSSS
ncbi:hypothetical protein E4T39_05618 [Aureobasidium subglaciale]|nr:hypothetical protein E4T39_05618 [Aureobasidium subglaciale]